MLDMGRGFLLHGRAIAAGQQALVVERADLALQGTGRPVLGGGFDHVPVAGVVVFDA
ncbi:hypothetical protein D3C81_2270700 [compost metagenome]